MTRKILIPLSDQEIAPRFDLATEVMLAECAADGRIHQEKLLILPGPSAEKLCHMIITEGVHVVVCGGIEAEFYDYLTWKRVRVIDNVIGPYPIVLERLASGQLEPGDVLSSD